MSYRDRARDQRIADDAIADSALMCRAQGCPNRWSVDLGGGGMCGAHYRAEPHQWPIVTREQQDLVAQMVFRRQQTKPPARQLSRGEKTEILQRLRDVAASMAGRDGRDWARQLQADEKAGKPLSKVQREMWRAALRVNEPLSTWREA